MQIQSIRSHGDDGVPPAEETHPFSTNRRRSHRACGFAPDVYRLASSLRHWHVPYRVEIPGTSDDALETLVQLGAMDIDQTTDGMTALLPDEVLPDTVVRALGISSVRTFRAVPRDSGSVWLVRQREVQVGRVRIVGPSDDAPADAVRLLDSPVFGSGWHPTTALCLEALDELLVTEPVSGILDVGTGSGILALAALRLGVPQAVAVDTDDAAIDVARTNARLNGLDDRLQLMKCGPEDVRGQWPLVVANVLAAPLMDLAPVLVRRLASHGHLILSGIRSSLAAEVLPPYRNLGMRSLDSRARAGWTALILQTSW